MTKIIISVALAIAAALLNYTFLSAATKKYESQDFAYVVKAVVAKNEFTVINPDDIEVEKVPATYAEGNFLALQGNSIDAEGQNYLKGLVQFHITKTAIPMGSIITQAHIAENLDSAFSRKIPDDHRAVTIQVDEATGVAGLIKPRDRVDIIATFKVEAGFTQKGIPIQGLYTQTILTDVEVLAVGKDAGIGLSEELAGDPIKLQKQFAKATSLTLAVSPEDAQKLIHVRTAGDLSASLRPGPYDPSESSPIVPPITDTDVLDTDAVIVLKDQAYGYGQR